MKTLARLMIVGAFVFSLGQSGYAQMSAPAAPAAPVAPKAPAMPKATPGSMTKKAKSKECSAKATEQGLHGKARKEFREKCKAE